MGAFRLVRIGTRSGNDSREHTHGTDAQGARYAATWTCRIDGGLIPVRHRPLRGEAVCRIPRPAAPIFRGADFPLRRSSGGADYSAAASASRSGSFVRMVTNSSAAEGWMPRVASNWALVAPHLMANIGRASGRERGCRSE